MTLIRSLLLVAVLPTLAVLAAGQAGLLVGEAPARLGVTDGRLIPPRDTPNSVSSQADLYPGHAQQAYARIAPLSYSGNGRLAMQKLVLLLRQFEGATVVEAKPDYVYVQFQTPWLKFVDDAEFWLDPAGGSIALRSASRTGRSDLGLNRERIEKIRSRFGS